ncbi:ribosomal RNA small subunit methyltransferase A [bacterium]|nr:ribosomal RNA small subunit methyltransferase A [bacterium]
MPKPRLGQHFLVDLSFLGLITKSAELSRTDAVIEVGPGKGVLTKALLAQAGMVLAMEIDERLANRLHEKLGHSENLEIRHQDARRVDWQAVNLELRQKGYKKVKMVSNLPYYLATQMVIHLLATQDGCERIVIMVQEEVARRMCAQPGGRDYSAYSIAVQYYGKPSFIKKVPASAFQPPPRVSSAIVCIDRRSTPPIELSNPEYFFILVHGMFMHRRKTLRKCLQGVSGMPTLLVWEKAIAQAGIDFKRRPETLDMGEVARIVTALEK